MDTPGKTDVLVVGAGVSGLTSAVCLAEAGLAVRIIAKDSVTDCTSFKAGASWGPYMSADPRIIRWSWASHTEFAAVAGPTGRGNGVRFMRGMEAAEEPTELEEWATQLPDYRPCTRAELPGRFSTGWWYTIPIVDMPTYLAYLRARLSPHATVEAESVTALAELGRRAEVVVNCTGLGARALTGDASLTATRGQLVVVADPGLDWFFQDSAYHGDLTYFLPHGTDVILGGSALPGNENLVEDRAMTTAIIQRCAEIEPRLKDPEIREVRVGLRPSRAPGVRLELEHIAGTAVVHNYGHGGSGVTVSWGCAQDVVDLVRTRV